MKLGIPSFSARSHMSSVWTSTPSTPETTKQQLSTTLIAEMASPMKSR